MPASIKRLAYFLIVILCASACDKGSTPPPTILIESLPSALEKAFTKAEPDAKKMVGEILSQLKIPDYATAYTNLQALSGTSHLNKEQSQVTSAGLLTIHSLLLSAQSKGDPAAAQTLNAYRINK